MSQAELGKAYDPMTSIQSSVLVEYCRRFALPGPLHLARVHGPYTFATGYSHIAHHHSCSNCLHVCTASDALNAALGLRLVGTFNRA